MNLNKISRKLSLVLRHDPDALGIKLDSNGWTDVDKLIEKLNSNGLKCDLPILERVVAENNKQRFSFDQDHKRIRANQGHSVDVDVELEQVKPPDILFHGTASKYIDSIMQNGLDKRARQHVHLSPDKSTAVNVGQRHGKPIVLEINAKQMHEEGYLFFKSKNGVWLTEKVPVKYITNDN